jgi:hypothetical protein
MVKYFVALVAVTIGFYFASQIIFDDFSSQSQTLSQLWREDVENLEAKKILPPAFHNLREIEWVTPDVKSKEWAKFLKVPFELKPDGEYRLELLVLSQEDGPVLAVIQHHLIHIKTGNSVWELGRTYTLPAE